MRALLPFRLAPDYRERVWGGRRLKRSQPPIGEAWIVYEENRVADGDYAGQTLSDIVAVAGVRLLGRRVAARTGGRFPLLIKLLDCADWLSVQVHPNDEQARELEGPEHFGKTEAWHILSADPSAQIIAGVKPGTSRAELAEAIRSGAVLDRVQYHRVAAGDTFFIPAGTLHALGPGILLYEVQQTSDLTYRVFDWNRPLSAGRQLHIEKSAAVADPNLAGAPIPMPPLAGGRPAVLAACPYFALRTVALETQTAGLDTEHETFHLLTVVEGEVSVQGHGWAQVLGPLESLVVPADIGAYAVASRQPARLLIAGVE